MGEVDLGPRLAGDVLEMEQPGDGHRAQDFVEGIAPMDADRTGAGLGGEEGEVFGGDLEEADGFTHAVGVAGPFLDEIEWSSAADGHEHGIVVLGLDAEVDEHGGRRGGIDEAPEELRSVENVAVHDEDGLGGGLDDGERDVHADGAALGEVRVVELVDADSVACGEFRDDRSDLVAAMAGDQEEVLHADSGEVLGVAVQKGAPGHREEDFWGVRKRGSQPGCPSGGIDDSGVHAEL